jgi:hypothetical protein
MSTSSAIGILWAVVGILFVWLIVRYGISQGKQRDVAKEFEDEHFGQSGESMDSPMDSKEKRDRRVS